MTKVSKAQQERVESAIEAARLLLAKEGIQPDKATDDQALNALPEYEEMISNNERKVFGTAWRKRQRSGEGPAPEVAAEVEAPEPEAEAPEPTPEPEAEAEDQEAAPAPAPVPAATDPLPPGVRISRDGFVKIATNKPVMARWKADHLALTEGDGGDVVEVLERVPTSIEVRDEAEYALLKDSAEASEVSARLAGDRAGKSHAGAMRRIVEKLEATRHVFEGATV